ncbi:MAG TPA: helix-turn-helix domain-containing protein [Gammaproteobacteria bacterium]|jgi:predicted HTH transcriptional regulator|nr:helix-turn-helix domain-containing protein [Gammaproteobacteria bacterium]
MDIAALLQQTEGKTVEFKQDLSSHEAVVKTLIAFANTSGGVLVIGVEDKTKKIKGLENPLNVEEKIANLISTCISPTLIPNIEVLPWRKTYLLAVEIYPSNNRPHFLMSKGLEKGTYIRIGSTNRLADLVMLRELQRISRSEAYDELPMAGLSEQDIDFAMVSELFSVYRVLKKSDYETLRLVIKDQGRNVPTHGGMILFGKNREKYFPDAWIQAGRFEGQHKKNILDFADIHLCPIKAIDEVIKFIQKHLTRSMQIEEVRRDEKWSVPEVAIREAVINAVAHADYAQRGAPIRVAIFDDRIEIENPGLLPFSLTIDDLHQGVSKLRNPVIGRIFHELKLIERWGSGISRMIKACSEAGLAQPKLEEIGTHFRVTIYTQQRHASTFKPDKTDQNILSLLRKNNGFSTKEIAEHIGLSTRATRTRLVKLLKQGLIVEVGSGSRDPNKKYLVAR